MATSFVEATRKLLGGNTLSWTKFGEHKAGSIVLGTPAQRRLFAFLLAQDASKVAQGDESLFNGLIAAWNNVETDPASQQQPPASSAVDDVWRLDRIETSGFGGLNLHGGPKFDLRINGENWCLEGQNGSGKTSLTNAILWALTGRRIREQDGPVEVQCARMPVTNIEGKKIGEWPFLASYPSSVADLLKPVEVWVRLTFKNTKGELAVAYRRLVCPCQAVSPSRCDSTEAKIDSRLLAAPEFVETGLLMPARMAKIGFGDKSQSLYAAVKMLTGLDQLADIAEGCGQLTHGARRFLRYGKDNGIEGFRTKFEEHIAEAQRKAKEISFTLRENIAVDDKNVVNELKDSATSASSEAGAYLATLKSEIAADIDTTVSEGRLKVRTAVSAARAIATQGARGIAVFDAWKALTDATQHQPFAQLPADIEGVRSRLRRALGWHRRQLADARFRLKAMAAQSFVPPHEHTDISQCPLCASALSSNEQRALAAELAELKSDAEDAERKIDDVCRSLQDELNEHLPAGLKLHWELLSTMDPRESYTSAIAQRFCTERPFSDVLIGLAARLKVVVESQQAMLPSFSFPEFHGEATEPSSVLALRRFMHQVERVVSLVSWFSANRQLFLNCWGAIVGQKRADDTYPPNSIEDELRTLELALAKADPLDEIARLVSAAAKDAESWSGLRKHQALREAIAKGLEPLKDLRALVAAETARSIANLSTRIKDILERIHLRERLVYEQASLGKKAVNVVGAFESGMQIDAAPVANTSWLRAILWAFVFALREETIDSLCTNPFPLMVLDDPQTTFDPRNKRKWAQELARLANMNRNDRQGIQLLLTTNERLFFQCLVDHEKLVAEHGLIAGVNKACGVATIVNGGCLERILDEALANNDDARARDYIAAVRIYCEDLLKFMLRGEGSHIPGMTLDRLKNELKRLHDAHATPFDRRVFTDLLNTLAGGGGKAMKLINESHHKDDESIGLAEAADVHEFWRKKLVVQIHDAFDAYNRFESFYGEPRTYPWAKRVIGFPAGFKESVGTLRFRRTGIAAAAKTDGHAGDGILTVEEWTAATQILLPNHEVYQLAAGTLDPVAGIGDLLIVSDYAKIHPRNLVVAAFGESLLARRYNRADAHPEIIILTGQSVDPLALPEPIIASPESTQIKKVVGTIFAARALPTPAMDLNREFVSITDPAALAKMLDGTRLLQVKGRSAEPIALEGQFLITREATKSIEEVKALDGRPIVAFDEDGTRFFKRLRCSGAVAILESLNPDGTAAAELLSFDGSLGRPKLTHALEVIGVLFELPTS